MNDIIKFLIVWVLTFLILLFSDKLLSYKDKNKVVNKHYYKFIFFFSTLILILNYLTFYLSEVIVKIITK